MRLNSSVFLVDGFNLYHSLRDAEVDLESGGMRWLNVRSLLEALNSSAIRCPKVDSVHFFTALSHHQAKTSPGILGRQQKYLSALKSTGIKIEFGRFKRASNTCGSCGTSVKRREEKESDVAIASKLSEALASPEVDTAGLVSGDTDLVPAVRTAKRMYPSKRVLCLFPHRRMNKDLSAVADRSFSIRSEMYRRHQFPERLSLPNGKQICKPEQW